jgi:hypothetical protein
MVVLQCLAGKIPLAQASVNRPVPMHTDDGRDPSLTHRDIRCFTSGVNGQKHDKAAKREQNPHYTRYNGLSLLPGGGWPARQRARRYFVGQCEHKCLPETQKSNGPGKFC